MSICGVLSGNLGLCGRTGAPFLLSSFFCGREALGGSLNMRVYMHLIIETVCI